MTEPTEYYIPNKVLVHLFSYWHTRLIMQIYVMISFHLYVWL